METKAVAKFVRIPATKARIVIDVIRDKRVPDAINTLELTNKAAARLIEKVLRSALANAQHNHGIKNPESLIVKEAFVDSATMMKRIRPRAMGRANWIRRRTSHITIILSDEKN